MAYDFYSDFEGYEMLDEQYPYQEEEEENLDGSISELLEHCIIPTLQDTYPNILQLFIVCLVFRVLIYFSQFHKALFSLSSTVCGTYILYVFFNTKLIHVITLTISGYFLFKIIPNSWRAYKGYVVGLCLLFYLFLGEFLIVKYDAWETIRGTQMIVAMKILSFIFDASTGVVKEINVLDFFGYILCPANCIFGPWVSYTDYKNLKNNDNFNTKWVTKIFQSLILAVLFFIASVCFLEWIITEESSIVWIIYRNAMLYRVGHYFICYISEVSSLISGFGGRNWDVTVTRPLSIELPYSLVQVVVNWNLPMHRWLKVYVFKTTMPFGGFTAVMLTYLVSALLHGFNIRLAAVLLSLGVYTYVEHCLRNCLSDIFSACISSKPCPTHCTKHRRTTRNLLVHIANLNLMAIAMFHLAYLGILINMSNTKPPTSLESTFEEWSNLKYVSHWVVLATFCIYLIIHILS